MDLWKVILLVSTNMILQKILKFLYRFYSSKFLRFLHYTLYIKLYYIHEESIKLLTVYIL